MEINMSYDGVEQLMPKHLQDKYSKNRDGSLTLEKGILSMTQDICKKIAKGWRDTGKSPFKSLDDTNEDGANLLIYYIANSQLRNEVRLTPSELTLLINKSDLNHLTNNLNTALNVALSYNSYLLPSLTSDMWDILINNTTVLTKNASGQTSFNIAIDNYFRENLTLSKEQLNILYENHLKLTPLDTETSQTFTHILKTIEANNETVIKNKELIDSYLNNDFSKLENKDKEIKELKQMVLSLNEKIISLEDKLNTGIGFLNIEDKPSLKTNNKLHNAFDKLTLSKKEQLSNNSIKDQEFDTDKDSYGESKPTRRRRGHSL